jgi:genome maintenance exonuclease 1|tara:strand:+ start:5864 stop:6547 length:684 start_codon:yes stop_codon:yes gene_type:complete
MSKFKFIELDKNKLPKTKGKKIDGFRFYDINGKNYPSITTVLGIQKKKELQKWRDSIGEDVANWEMGRAARRGKATHTLVEQYLKGETPSERSVLPLGMFRLLKPYVDQINNIHCLETIMYSKKLTIAGQVDCIAEYNGKLSVIDFKTANKERQESWIENYFLQTCAYSIMYEELFGEKIDQLVILIAGEDGTMTPFVKQRAPYEEKLGESIQAFYKHYEELNGKKV